jgi:hypothetical protein
VSHFLPLLMDRKVCQLQCFLRHLRKFDIGCVR